MRPLLVFSRAQFLYVYSDACVWRVWVIRNADQLLWLEKSWCRRKWGGEQWACRLLRLWTTFVEPTAQSHSVLCKVQLWTRHANLNGQHL